MSGRYRAFLSTRCLHYHHPHQSGTFVTVERVLTHHHPKSTVDLRVTLAFLISSPGPAPDGYRESQGLCREERVSCWSHSQCGGTGMQPSMTAILGWVFPLSSLPSHLPHPPVLGIPQMGKSLTVSRRFKRLPTLPAPLTLLPRVTGFLRYLSWHCLSFSKKICRFSAPQSRLSPAAVSNLQDRAVHA